MASIMPILITGARAPVALHLARLLVQAGHPVTLVDHLKHPLAAASRLNVDYHRIPAFSAQPKAAQTALQRLITAKGIGLVIPTCEEALHLAVIWARTRMGAKLFAPDFALLRQVHNKMTFIELCRDIDLKVPQTRLLTGAADLATCASSARNLVFKPVWSRFGSKVLIRPTARRLRRISPTPARPWVAQEYLSGKELCVYAVAQQGRILALSAYRGLVRAGPGAAVCFAPVDTETVHPFVQRFAQATGWTGQVSFDLIQTEAGQILPLECNPRSTGGLHFFTDCVAFSKAVFGTGPEVTPDIQDPQAVRLAMWLYGLPMMLRPRQRSLFRDASRQAGDVMDWPGDRLGLWPQLRSVAEFAGIALRLGISLESASTWGIEWNGEG